MSSAKKTWNWQRLKERSLLAKLMVASLLLCLLAVVAAPSYFTGNWSWQKPVSVQNIQAVRGLRQTALALNNWEALPQAQLLNGGAMPLHASSGQNLELRPARPAAAIATIDDVRNVQIGGERWAYLELTHPEAGQPPIGVYLLPQMHHDKLPEVEWTDIRGTEGWEEESSQVLQVTATAGDRQTTVKARFFRAAAERTYAVVQWYAWPTGGARSPIAWFWRDQWAQLHQRRQPWVAVYLKIPMRAQSELESMQPLAASLAQDVQAALMADIFTPA